MQELRYLEKENGEKVLQYKVIEPLEDGFRREVKWYDVPTIPYKGKKRMYVIQHHASGEMIVDIVKGMGKGVHFSVTSEKEEALHFASEVEARIFIEENGVNIMNYNIVKA